jgi:exodeoxyribonuclease VII large subunit
MQNNTSSSYLSVKDINTIISDKCRASFPTELAVIGLVHDWKLIKDSFVIFKLVDHADNSFCVTGLIPTAHWRRINQYVSDKTPGDSTSVVVLGKPSVQKSSGVLRFLVSQLQIEAPPLEELRRIGLGRLESEGVAKANQTLRLPEVPLRVGLLAPDSSAGLEDFVHQLMSSQIGFRVRHFACPMNGPVSKGAIAKALRVLSRERVDALAICRGGGARSDLGVFDEYDVAREICAAPIPIITGIGHQSDNTLADLVAHHSCITPTAAANYLIEKVVGYHKQTCQIGQQVTEILAWRTLDRLENSHHRIITFLASRSQSALLIAAQYQNKQIKSLQRTTKLLAIDQLELTSFGSNLGARLRSEAISLDDIADSAKRYCALSIGSHADDVTGLVSEIKAASPALAGENTHFKSLYRVLHGLTLKAIQNNEQALDRNQQVLRLRDPKLLLRQGLAFVRSEHGLIVKDASSLHPGQRIRIQLRDGMANCRVQHKPQTNGEK